MVDIRKLKVTCIERKYKVQGEKSICVIKAKREFDEDLTERLLHEDMELKTFLTEYEIEKIEEKEDHKTETIEVVQPKKIANKKIEVVQANKKIENVSEMPTPEQRISLVMHTLPDEFALGDIVKYYSERDDKRDIQVLKRLYSYTFQYLKNHEIIKIINPEANSRLKRYNKIEGATEKIKILDEQQKTPLEVTV